MPVLNRVKTIEKALLSVFAQQYPHIEFIIMDGGSTDGTLDVIKKYESNISYWQSARDLGPTDAYNQGIARATGDLIVLLMADDWYEPGILQAVAQAYQHHPEAEVISCGGRIVKWDDDAQRYQTQWEYAKYAQVRLSFKNICFGVSAICCRFIRKECYERLGLYILADAKGVHMLSNDKEFLLRAVVQGVQEVFIPQVGHTYLASKDSSTFGGHYPNILRLCEEHIEIAKNYLQKTHLTFTQRLWLHYWLTDQFTRLVLYSLLTPNLPQLIRVNASAMRAYTLLWPLALTFNSCKITLKRVLALFQGSGV